MTKLVILNLDGNQIQDITPISELIELQRLHLGWNGAINDLTPISGLIDLLLLELSENQISDLTPISSLINLLILGLGDNQINDITPLSELVNLEDLNIRNNQISDLNPISDLTNVLFLELSENQISNLTPISGLINLLLLGLSENQISDLTPISGLINLLLLGLGDNQISDVTPLSSLVNLWNLNIENNQISDLTSLSNLSEHTPVWASGQKVTQTVEEWQSPLIVSNLAKGPNGNSIPPNEISNEGTYHDGMITWTDLTVDTVTYAWDEWLSSSDDPYAETNVWFSGAVTVTESAVQSYTITFDANGGENAPEAQTKTHGVPLVLTTDEPNRLGYTFGGWATTADAVAAEYQPGDIFTRNEQMTLYAVWEKEEIIQVDHLVRFFMNDGTDTVIRNLEVPHGEMLPASEVPEAPERLGWYFQGWGLSADATNIVAVETITIEAALDFYAIWRVEGQLETHEVRFLMNDSTDTVIRSLEVPHGEMLTALEIPEVPERLGWYFQGWGLSAEATGTVAVEEIPIEEAINFYAVWEEETKVQVYHTVSFLMNDGTDSVVSTLELLHGISLSVTEIPEMPERSGWTFQGWALSADATATLDPQTVTIEATTNFYAIWEREPEQPEIHEVRFLMNDGTNTVIRTVEIPHGELIPVTAIPLAPGRLGWIFQGWALSADATATLDPQTVTIEAATNFYAVWEREPEQPRIHEVRFLMNDSTNTVIRIVEIPHGELIPATAIPLAPGRLGWTFQGWSLSADRGPIVNLQTVQIEEAMNFYARWERESTGPVDSPGGQYPPPAPPSGGTNATPGATLPQTGSASTVGTTLGGIVLGASGFVIAAKKKKAKKQLLGEKYEKELS